MSQTTVAEPNSAVPESAENQVALTSDQFDRLSNAAYSVNEIAFLVRKASSECDSLEVTFPGNALQMAADQLIGIVSEVVWKQK